MKISAVFIIQLSSIFVFSSENNRNIFLKIKFWFETIHEAHIELKFISCRADIYTSQLYIEVWEKRNISYFLFSYTLALRLIFLSCRSNTKSPERYHFEVVNIEISFSRAPRYVTSLDIDNFSSALRRFDFLFLSSSHLYCGKSLQ